MNQDYYQVWRKQRHRYRATVASELRLRHKYYCSAASRHKHPFCSTSTIEDITRFISQNVNTSADMSNASLACYKDATETAHDSLRVRLARKDSGEAVILCSEIAENLAHVQYLECKKMNDVDCSKPFNRTLYNLLPSELWDQTILYLGNGDRRRLRRVNKWFCGFIGPVQEWEMDNKDWRLWVPWCSRWNALMRLYLRYNLSISNRKETVQVLTVLGEFNRNFVRGVGWDGWGHCTCEPCSQWRDRLSRNRQDIARAGSTDQVLKLIHEWREKARGGATDVSMFLMPVEIVENALCSTKPIEQALGIQDRARE